MKKLLFALMACSVLAFTACGDDDDDENPASKFNGAWTGTISLNFNGDEVAEVLGLDVPTINDVPFTITVENILSQAICLVYTRQVPITLRDNKLYLDNFALDVAQLKRLIGDNVPEWVDKIDGLTIKDFVAELNNGALSLNGNLSLPYGEGRTAQGTLTGSATKKL